MNSKLTPFAIFALGAAIIAAACIVHNGLVAVATAVREKPLPALPESISIRELTIRQATVEAPSATTTNHNVSVRIENMRLDAQIANTNGR